MRDPSYFRGVLLEKVLIMAAATHPGSASGLGCLWVPRSSPFPCHGYPRSCAKLWCGVRRAREFAWHRLGCSVSLLWETLQLLE